MANDCEDQTRPKSRRRWLFAGGIVLTLAVVALASWQYSARPSGATSPSLRWAKASCLTQVVGNASQLVPTGKATTVVVSFEHLRPLNGKKEGTTWIVLKNGAAESGYWCALGDNADFAESGPVATLIRPKHPLVQRAAYIGSTDRVGYVGLVARVPSSVSRVIIVTATGSTVVKPVAEQLGHASIRVTKDVYGHLLPRSRARAAEAMRSVLFDDEASSCPQESDALATQSATPRVANRCLEPAIRPFVGRPGLDPGTLGPAPEGSVPSVTIRLRSSAAVPSSLSFAGVLSSAVDWLQVWLHERPGMIAEISLVDERGSRVEMRFEGPSSAGADPQIS